MALHLNIHPQLFLGQYAQFLGQQRCVIGIVVGRGGRFHERFVFGSVPNLVPGMGESQNLEIIPEPVSHHDFVLDQSSDRSLRDIVWDGTFGGEVGFGNAGNEGPVVRHLLFDADHGIVESVSVPIDEGYASKARVESVGPDADHFGIQCNVARFFFGCERWLVVRVVVDNLDECCRTRGGFVLCRSFLRMTRL